jgi:hypothetical protein
VLIGRTDEHLPGIAQQVLTVYRQLASDGQTAVAYAEIVNLYRYNFNSQREFLQSKKLLLMGLAKMVNQLSLLISPLLMFFVFAGLFKPNIPSLLDFLLPCFLGFCLGIMQLSGRTIWGDSVLDRYHRASTHADRLQRIALLGPAAMTNGRLDDLRSLMIKNVAPPSDAGCGC